MKSVVAIIIFICFLCFLDAYFYSLPSIYKTKQLIGFSENQQVPIVILGSSHALFGIRPDKLSEPALNLANVSQSLDLDEKLLQKELKKNHALKLVIIPVSYFSLEESLTKTVEEWRDCLYFRYFGLSERNVLQICRDPRYWSLPILYRSASLDIAKIDDGFTLASYQMDNSGWVINTKSLVAAQAEQMGKQRVDLFQSFMDPLSFESHKKILQRMIEFCRTNNVKVLLVNMPAWVTFRKFVDKNKVSQTRRLLKSLVVAGEVAYGDYLEDNRFKLSDFADTDHLNKAGAVKLSSILDRDFIAPMLACR